MQPVTTYSRNRNNPDSKIPYRPINSSSKVLLKKRPKCLLSCDTEVYFQGGRCRQVPCAAANRPHGSLCTCGREDGDEPHRACSLDLQQELGGAGSILDRHSHPRSIREHRPHNCTLSKYAVQGPHLTAGLETEGCVPWLLVGQGEENMKSRA